LRALLANAPLRDDVLGRQAGDQLSIVVMGRVRRRRVGRIRQQQDAEQDPSDRGHIRQGAKPLFPGDAGPDDRRVIREHGPSALSSLFPLALRKGCS
jgi:hypothetical protein